MPDKGEFDKTGEPLSTLLKHARSYGNDTVDKLVENQAIMGLQLGLVSGDGERIRVGEPVYAAVL